MKPTIAVALGLMAIALAPGCMTSEYIPNTYYDVAPQIEVPSAGGTHGASIGVRPLMAGLAYGDAMLYRQEGYALRQYEHALWADSPAAIVTHALVTALRGAQTFTDVGYAAAMQQPDYVLTGRLLAFEEMRRGDERLALCRLDVAVRSAQEDRTLFAGEVTGEVPMESDTKLALAAAMSEAVAQVAEELANALAP